MFGLGVLIRLIVSAVVTVGLSSCMCVYGLLRGSCGGLALDDESGKEYGY